MQSELFDIVDDNDKIIGRATRKEAHTKCLTHRSVMFFIFNKKGELFLNKRSSNKEFEGGKYSIVLGGHIKSGDSYEQSVIREAEEEAGITSKPYFIANFKNRYKEKDKENCALYFFITDKVTLDKTEVEQGGFVKIGGLKKILKEKDFILETKILYKILLENKEKVLQKIKNNGEA